MNENDKDAIIKFEVLCGQQTKKKLLVPVEYPLFPMEGCFLMSLLPHGGEIEGRVIQEYGDVIKQEDVLHYKNLLDDLEMKGIMIGKATDIAYYQAKQNGIEIREPVLLRIKEL